MKTLLVIILLLLSFNLGQAQDNSSSERISAEEYTGKLVAIISGLQKNPWEGWKAGTEVVIRYLDDSDRTRKAFTYPQPDLVYRVLDADNFFIRTQKVNGKTTQQNFLVKDQTGLPAARVKNLDGVSVDLVLDGFKLTVLESTLSMETFPGGTHTTKDWSLVGYPSILLRQAISGSDWRVTSAKVLKKVGERGFNCIEIKKTMRIYSKGPIDVLTTQYLSPEVPGHLVEEIQEFYKLGNKPEQRALQQVVHQKVIEIKF